MRRRRGRFLKSLEENVDITGDRSEYGNLPDTGNGGIQNGRFQKTGQSIVILEDRTPRITPQGIVVQDLRYIGNISPPNPNIHINDQVTRFRRTDPNAKNSQRGSNNDDQQVLTVVDLEIIECGKVQQLQLRDQDRKVR